MNIKTLLRATALTAGITMSLTANAWFNMNGPWNNNSGWNNGPSWGGGPSGMPYGAGPYGRPGPYAMPYGRGPYNNGPWGGGPFNNGPMNRFGNPSAWMNPSDPKGSMSNMWDDMLNAPSRMGKMPDGWTAPSISVPNPIDVGDEFGNAMENMNNNNN